MSIRHELIRGSIEAVIVQLLSEQSKYGYEMIKTVNDRSDGYFSWKEGSLYPCLHRLESEGLITSFQQEANGRMRKYYTLTENGRRAAESTVAEAKKFCQALILLLDGGIA